MSRMKYISVCSGIEAATVAWHHLGWEPAWFSEIEPFPCSVLKHHYPNVPNLGDMTKWSEWPDETIDVLVGGTPCQSFSVAGKRGGMDDHRGQLALSFSAIAAKYKPRWIVWENVPGVLSSGGGRDFGSFLGSLVKLGYGLCYRVLDAQHFGVAQRRRRVFVVGHLGDWRRVAAVLFERESLCGNPAKGGKARKEVAGNVAPSLTASNDPSRSPQSSEITQQVAAVIEAQMTANPIVLMDQGGSVMNTLTDGTVGTLRREMHGHEPCVLAFAQNQLGEVRTGEVFNTINTNSNASGRNTPMVAFPANMSATQCASTEDVACNLQARNPTAVAVRTANTSANGHGVSVERAHTLDRTQGQAVATEVIVVNMGGNKGGASTTEDGTSFTLATNEPHAIAFKPGQSANARTVGAQEGVACTVEAGGGGNNRQAVAIGTDCYNGSVTGEVAATMGTHGSSSNSSGPTVMQDLQVRRLTPIECERLQGFPDNYTNVPHRGKPAADGPRYKALGN